MIQRSQFVRVLRPLFALILIAGQLISVVPLPAATSVLAAPAPAAAHAPESSAPLGAVAAPGFAVSDFATGFPASTCPPSYKCGPFGLAFDSANHVIVADQIDGQLYRFGPAGGVASAAQFSTVGVAPVGLAFGKDGRLYLTRPYYQDVVEVDPTSGGVVREIASGFLSEAGIATDPLSGDLFVTTLCRSPSIVRISNFASGPGTVTPYVDGPGCTDGITFGPDGTLYVAGNGGLMRVAGTNTVNPGAVTMLVTNLNMDGVALWAAAAPSTPPILFGNRNDGIITRIDLSTSPPTLTDIVTNGSRGDFATVGPDGCLYATQSDSIIKVTNSDGTCSFLPVGVNPQLSLSPNVIAPSPILGTPATFSAKLRNTAAPGGVPVTFTVTGANPRTVIVPSDANGVARLTYTGTSLGVDTVVATAMAGATSLTSNPGTATWLINPCTTSVKAGGFDLAIASVGAAQRLAQPGDWADDHGDPAKDHPPDEDHGTPTPTPTPSSSCPLYPIALNSTALEHVAPGSVLSDLANGTRERTFGWLTWTGTADGPALVHSLTPPGDSYTYLNPFERDDHVVAIGKWVHARSATDDNGALRDALQRLETLDITVPVWDRARGQEELDDRGHERPSAAQVANPAADRDGRDDDGKTLFRIAAFARVRLLSFQLDGQDHISVRFLGFATCGLPTATSTSTSTGTATSTPTATSTATHTGTPTATPTPTSTATATATATSTATPTPTNTATATSMPTASNTATPTSTPTLTNTPTSTSTSTPTPTATSSNRVPIAVDDLCTLSDAQTSIRWDVDGRHITFSIPAPGVLANDHHPDGLPLTAQLVTSSQHGALILAADGSFTYTPQTGFGGTDTFTYRATDGVLFSAPATVSLVVPPPPPAPTIHGVNIAAASNGGSILSASSNYGGIWDVAFLIDGRTDRGWSTLSGHTTNEVVIIALAGGGRDSIDLVRVDGAATGGDLATSAMRDFEIRISTTDSQPASFSTVCLGATPQQNAFVACAFPAAPARYLMLVGVNNHGGTSLQSAEIEAYTVAGLATLTPTPGATVTVTSSPTATPTVTATGTITQTPTATTTSTSSPTGTVTSTPTVTGTPTPTATSTSIPSGPTPSASLTTPADGSRVTSPITVRGTASSATLAAWSLSYELSGDPTSTRFASGTTSVVDGALGSFDPTLLLNGLYDITLTVTDVSGRSGTASVSVAVDGQQKIGVFSLSFTDMSIPVSGIPIRVVRTYDSRDKHTGDFGVGWNLDLKTVRVQTNGSLGNGWDSQQNFLNFCIVPAKPHLVTFTFSDGQVYRFEPVLDPACQGLSLPPEVTIRFRPLPGTTGMLAPLSTALVRGTGPIQLLDFNTLLPVDPTAFVLTLEDGTVMAVDRRAGLQRLTDPNGNTLTVGPNGITHSAGVGVTFQRDGQGRITRITDPLGQSLAYAYDAAGNLISVTDRAGHPTTFTYNTTHGLLTVTDALGITGVRSDYDASGRLVGVTDASGHPTRFAHDLGASREVITDRNGNTTSLTYDVQGNVATRTDGSGNTTSYTYDEFGRVLTETDPSTKTQTYTYDGAGHLLTVTDRLGRTTRSTYDSLGHQLTSTDANGNITSSSYDARGNLVSVTDPVHNITAFTRDPQGNVLTQTDAAGKISSMAYDSRGNLTRQTDALGQITTQSYDAGGQLLAITSPAGHTTAFDYDANGAYTRVTVAGEPTTFQTDAAGRITSVQGSTGPALGFEYDTQGRMIGTTLPDQAHLRRTYDPESNLATQTDTFGNVTTFQYDASSRLVLTTYPDASTERRAYDTRGQVVQKTDRNGHTTSSAYDAAGHLTQQTDALGGITSRSYDAVGHVSAVADPRGNSTQFTYDALGRTIATTFADGTRSSVEYDAVGNQVRLTDAAGAITAFGYDALHHLTSVTDALGPVTSYEYDTVGNRVAQVDANGHRTTFGYDPRGRLIRTTYPLGETESLTYDAAGRMATSTNGNGQVLTYTYDAGGRPVRLTLPDGTQESTTYTTDGLPATATDARGATQYAYEATTRRVSRVTEPDGRYVRYTYDAVGNRLALAHATATGAPEELTSYQYDALDRMSRVTDSAGGLTTYNYDAAGNVIGMNRPNRTTSNATFDSLNRLTSLAHNSPAGPALARFAYTLDRVGRRTAVLHADGSRVQYTYDALGRVTAEQGLSPSGATTHSGTYAYDAVGNIVGRGGTIGVATFTYNADDQLIAGDGLTYTYDASGNRISMTSAAGATTRYNFDARGRLVRVQPPIGAATDYSYDPDGVRMSVTGPTDSIRFLVDRQGIGGLSRVVRETNSASTTLRAYTYGSDLLKKIEGASVSFYHPDGLGSTRLLTDGTGTPTDTYGYTAYGDLLGHAGNSSNRYQFAGEPVDLESGLYHLRARYYAPTSGRFLSRDNAPGSERNPTSLNKYAYALDDPISLPDPTGNSTVKVRLGQVGIVARVHQLLGGIQGCDYDCGTKDTKEMTYAQSADQAIRDAKSIVAQTLKDLGSGSNLFAHYFVSFHRHDKWARHALTENFTEIYTKLDSPLTIAWGAYHCDAKTIAYVAPWYDPNRVNTCELWVGLPRIYDPSGRLGGPAFSKAGTLVHEVAHLALNIGDESHIDCEGENSFYIGPPTCYGLSNVEALAKAGTEMALRNADNYSNFAVASWFRYWTPYTR